MVWLWLPLILCLPLGNDRPVTLWEIGLFDGKRDELSGSRDYSEDPFYVVGLSSPEKDWPCLHTGPLDLWAGGREHTFTVCFDLAKVPARGDATLRIDTVDSYLIAPQLAVRVNGTVVERHPIPWGAPFAKPVGYEGYAYSFTAEVPGRLLLEGQNRLDIVTVGGCFLYYDALRLDGAAGFEIGPPSASTHLQSVAAPNLLMERDGRKVQPVVTTVHHIGPSLKAELNVTGCPDRTVTLEEGRNVIESLVPAVSEPQELRVTLGSIEAGALVAPVRQWEVHLLHFTHLDIGYTHTQEEVEKKQMEYLDQAQELISGTADLPPEARFRWLPEGLWAVDSYLRAASSEKRNSFLEHARADRISLCAAYANELTGLCSDEELYRNLEFAVQLREEHGVPIDSLMLTDVPGCTWGMVPAMADSGIRYLSLGPNPNHRIGGTRRWDDKPFYWVSPCGGKRVLCWMAPGYGWFRSGAGERPVEMFRNSPLMGYLQRLEDADYPYDLVNLRYDVNADNGYPDPGLPDGVKQWNETYLSPRLIMSTPHQVFSELEKRYGHRLPSIRGDFTPYWEDGAASTAADTGLNRRAVERLVQAEALWALVDPGAYPVERFREAWRKVILYDEHTWGSWNSISDPDSDFSKQQAAYKKRFADDADTLSRELVEEAVGSGNEGMIELFNTLSWPRTDLVLVPESLSAVGDCVKGEDGKVVPSQRLASGELAFLAQGVPGLGSALFTIEPGAAPDTGSITCNGATLSSDDLKVTIDKMTGAIQSLHMKEIPVDLVDRTKYSGLNDYIYVEGRHSENQKKVDRESVKLEIIDPGPLVATIEVRSSAPGAKHLLRRVRLIHGLARVDVTDVVDKKPVREKEGVLFAFPFNVPDCEVRLDMPWAVVRPEKDQIPGSCKNFFAVQRWVDVANAEYGVTLATIDAPLVQVGEVRTDVLDDSGWIERIEPSPILYSYVMNNYWETNYKADQEGPARFDYSIRPYQGRYNQTQAQRFGFERHRPLIAAAARKHRSAALHLTLDAPGVVLTSLKPAKDGKTLLVRLFAASGKPESALLNSGGTDTAIDLPAYGVATLRVK